MEIPEHLRRPGVRLAAEADLAALAGSMARAFADDPALGFLLGSARRLERLESFFEAELRIIAFPHEIVWATDDLSAAAIWARPGEWRVPVGPSLRELPAMVRVFGARLPLAFWTRLRMEARHPSEPPSYYLAAIGVEPAAQGKGLGSELMKPMLARIDSEGAGAYLETSTARSRGLYERTASCRPARSSCLAAARRSGRCGASPNRLRSGRSNGGGEHPDERAVVLR